MNIVPMIAQLCDVRVRQIACHCEAHLGDTVTQLDAQLPGGRRLAVMEDWRGLHVSIGSGRGIGKHPYTQPVSEEQAAQMIREALGV